MEIIHRQEAIHKEKPDGTRVDYYLQQEYELHYNEIPPRTVQEWHSHSTIEELIFIVGGSIEARWLENGEVHKETAKKGDLIRVGDTAHTFANIDKETASFIVIKLVLAGKNNSQIFKEDKIPTKPIKSD